MCGDDAMFAVRARGRGRYLEAFRFDYGFILSYSFRNFITMINIFSAIRGDDVTVLL